MTKTIFVTKYLIKVTLSSSLSIEGMREAAMLLNASFVERTFEDANRLSTNVDSLLNVCKYPNLPCFINQYRN